MNAIHIIAAAVAVALLVYLIYALVRAENF
jgi:K+-transporting ATPase KdpF subunit